MLSARKHSLWLGDAGTCHCGRGSFRPETGCRVLPAFYPDADGGRASTAAPAGCGRGPSGAGCYRTQHGAAALIRASFHEKHADRRILPFCRGNRPSACLAAGQRPGSSVHSPFDPHPYDPHGNGVSDGAVPPDRPGAQSGVPGNAGRRTALSGAATLVLAVEACPAPHRREHRGRLFQGASCQRTARDRLRAGKAFRGRGFATEAVRALCQWALSRPGVQAVEAETEPGNAASQHVLQKNGFLPMGILGAEGPRFALEKRF